MKLFQILQYTPENHPDRQNLVDALSRAEELCNQVNEGVRERENSDKLEWMQSHVQCEGLQEVGLCLSVCLSVCLSLFVSLHIHYLSSLLSLSLSPLSLSLLSPLSLSFISSLFLSFLLYLFSLSLLSPLSLSSISSLFLSFLLCLSSVSSLFLSSSVSLSSLFSLSLNRVLYEYVMIKWLPVSLDVWRCSFHDCSVIRITNNGFCLKKKINHMIIHWSFRNLIPYIRLFMHHVLSANSTLKSCIKYNYASEFFTKSKWEL